MPLDPQHFAQDDPELYNGKIRHLLEHGVDKLDDELFFIEEYIHATGQIKVKIGSAPGRDRTVYFMGRNLCIHVYNSAHG